MNFLEIYPDILTVEDVAEILKVSVGTVYGLHGLVKIRIGEGRGIIRIRKSDLIDFINSRAQQEVNLDASKKTERYRKVGLPDLLTREEIQRIRVEHQTGSPGRS